MSRWDRQMLHLPQGWRRSRYSSQRHQAAVLQFPQAAPLTPQLRHHRLTKDACGTTLAAESATLTNSLCEPGWSIWATIADQTRPRAGSSGVQGSPRMPMTARIDLSDRSTVPPEKDHCGCTMPRDVGTAAVDHVSQVQTGAPFTAGEVLLNELLAELPLHKTVGGDLPYEPAFLLHIPVATNRQLEQPLHERHGERVFSVAGRVSFAVGAR